MLIFTAECSRSLCRNVREITIDPFFDGPHSFGKPNLEDGVLNPLPFLLPLLPFIFTRTKTKTNDDEGLPCPPMRPDRPGSNNAAGQLEEFRLSLLINPTSPTPKRTPATPWITSMAYYLPTGKRTQEVALDDCKRTDEPSLIPNVKKGTVVESKTKGSAALSLAPWGPRAAHALDNQFRNQFDAIRHEGKERSLVYCVGSFRNAEGLRHRYPVIDFPNTFFQTCP